MLSAVGQLLPLAVGVAISPIPIVAVVLMLMSRNAGATSAGFAAGWVAGIAAVLAVVAAAAGAIHTGDGSEPSPAVGWVKIGLGVLLVGLAGKQLRARGDHSAPKWMQAIDSFTLGKAAGLGFVLAAVNPKNLLLCVSAGLQLGTAELSVGAAAGAGAIFVVLAATTVLVPVIGYRLAAERLRAPLAATQQWLSGNNHLVMAIVLALMGASVIGKGLEAL
ncbi:GAP family protein [Nocardia asteroides]|uniref:GAP family protein n=1 Tax=Nocardia asteroides TaxID=1824 RepID=UPI001E4C7EBF|nr:GAP family protein [Nocardia asteroides]UGT61915.1 GAP family protein [Nocardia asteroides]